MPYYITDQSPDCDNWAVVKEDGELVGCHNTKESAIDQMVAASLAEGLEPAGEYDGSFRESKGEAIEERAVDLTPPAFMRAAARRGLALYEEGHGGDGLVPRTIREAREMAAGRVTADKWQRIAAWIARHLVDLDAPKNYDREDSQYPGEGLVAHLLWGSGPSKRRAVQAMEFAKRKVEQIANDERARHLLDLRRVTKGDSVNLNHEIRSFDGDIEIREESDGMTFMGYAAVFDSPSDGLPFRETIAPGAFQRTLKAGNDIKLLMNHDSGRVLASTRAKTLRLIEDDRGLRVEADLPPTTDGKDLQILLKRGDISAMSFGFSVPAGGDSWNNDGNERTLNSIRLHEVSVVAFPAYPATTANVRALDSVAKRTNVDADALQDALLALEAGDELEPAQSDLITEVVMKLTRKTEAIVEEETPSVSLDVLKKKLDLLMKRV